MFQLSVFLNQILPEQVEAISAILLVEEFQWRAVARRRGDPAIDWQDEFMDSLTAALEGKVDPANNPAGRQFQIARTQGRARTRAFSRRSPPPRAFEDEVTEGADLPESRIAELDETREQILDLCHALGERELAARLGICVKTLRKRIQKLAEHDLFSEGEYHHG